ncbi:MAG: tRNA (adenosine(37)-N6)-threonylcarbamoyltransferase complex dimerization subunit type 1 TsaB [Desulfarculaceae bacterium]
MLAIDTALKSGGVGLAQGGQVLGEVMLNASATHSRRLVPAIDFLLKQAGKGRKDLQGLAVTIGPGFFTGLRVGLATAQGLALGLGLPVCPVSSLRLLAEGLAGWRGRIWAVADARREMVYAAAFSSQNSGLERLEADAAMPPARLAQALEPPALLVGDGARLYEQELALPQVELAPAWADLPRPGLLALLGGRRLARGGGLAPEELKARYLRPSEAEVRFGLPLDEYRVLE